MRSINSKPSSQHIVLFSFLRYFIALIGLGVSLAVYYSTLYYLIGDFVYNSDSLYLPSLYADVIHGNDLSQWNLPPSSYVFPDMLLYFVVRIFTPSIQSAAVAFGIAQYLIFALGLMLLAKQALPRSYGSIAPSLIALMSICFVLLLTNLEFYSQMIFVSAHHFGIVLMMPFVLAITHKLMAESQVNVPLICILCGLSFLATLSDWLYLVQVAIPLAVTLVILCGLKRNDLRSTLVVASALVAPSLMGLGASLTYIWNRPMLTAYMISPHPMDWTFWQLVNSLTSIPPYHAILAIIFLSICAFVFAKTIAPIILRKASALNSGSALLPLYFFLAFVVNSLAVIGSGIFADRDGFRYLLPVIIFSGFWGLPFIVTIPETIVVSLHRIAEGRLRPLFTKMNARLEFNFTAEIGEWAIIGAVGLFAFLAWGSIDWQGFIFDYYPPFIQCLDEKTSALGIRNGIANYWQARPISLLSHNNLKLVQLNRDLSTYNWINNTAEYATAPEFAVIDTSFPENFPFRLDENLITSRFGKPDTTFECEDNKILVYRSNDEFKSLFRGALPK